MILSPFLLIFWLIWDCFIRFGFSSQPWADGNGNIKNEKEELGTKIMEAPEDNFVEYEEIIATLLKCHIKAVEEDKGEVDEDSMDVYKKKS